MKDIEALTRAIKNLSETVKFLTEVLLEILDKL